MNATTLEASTAEAAVKDRVLDATRRAAHLSHEARLLKSLATDAIEDGAYAARRALKTMQRRAHRLEDMKNDAIHQVRRQPVKALAIAAAAGAVFGLVLGFLSGSCRHAAASR